MERLDERRKGRAKEIRGIESDQMKEWKGEQCDWRKENRKINKQ